MLTVVLLIVSVAMAAAAAVSHGADRTAVVKLAHGKGMLSGVIVDPSGLVLSVSHGEFQPNEPINVQLHDGTRTTGKLVWPGELPSEDVVALRLPAGKYPFATLAKSAVQPGQIVWSFGYPRGQLDVLTGTVKANKYHRETDKPGPPTPTVVTTIPARGGHSGGPLFTLSGEVAGLLWMSDDALRPHRVQREGDSTFVSSERAVRAMEAAGAAVPVAPGRRTLYVFTGELCQPCEWFKREYAANANGLATALNAEYRVEIITRRNGQWTNSAAASAYTQAMGQQIETVPRFWIAGTNDGAQGYNGSGPLLQWLAEVRAPAPVPRDAPGPEINIGWQPPAQPAAPEAPDDINWSTAKIVVLRSNPDLSDTATAALRLGADQLGAPIRRRLNDLTRSAADVEILHEQVSPVRYAAVQRAIGQPAGKFLVCVMVRRRDVGLIRGAIVSRVTAALDDYVRGIPVEVISERQHPQDFAAVEAALATIEPPAGDGTYPWWYAVVAAVISAAVGFYASRWPRPLPAAPADPAPTEPADPATATTTRRRKT